MSLSCTDLFANFLKITSLIRIHNYFLLFLLTRRIIQDNNVVRFHNLYSFFVFNPYLFSNTLT